VGASALVAALAVAALATRRLGVVARQPAVAMAGAGR
jgi:hypothetical protein